MVTVKIQYRKTANRDDESIECSYCHIKGSVIEISDTNSNTNQSTYTFIPLDIIQRVTSTSNLNSGSGKDVNFRRG